MLTLVYYLHFYTCTTCSLIFVWWKHDLGLDVSLSFMPMVFFALLLTFLVCLFLNKEFTFLAYLLRGILSIFCLFCVIYGIYVLVLLQFAFLLSYIINIFWHLILLLLLVSDLLPFRTFNAKSNIS